MIIDLFLIKDEIKFFLTLVYFGIIGRRENKLFTA